MINQFHFERPLLPLAPAGARNLKFLSFRFLVQRTDSEWKKVLEINFNPCLPVYPPKEGRQARRYAPRNEQ
jgi:hypothetical protein